MKLIPTLSDTSKGILLIISGTVLLFNTLGFTTQLLYNVILFGSIAMIAIGFVMANFHKKIVVFITKNEKPKGPPEF